jgi:hypothetical protein
MSKAFVASGGTPPYTFSLSSGTGTVTSTGTYSTPGVAGTADVRVTDSGGQHADATVTIDSAVGFKSGPTAVDGGQALTLSGTGGQGPYTYSVVSGPGTVDASTGSFAAPSTAGTTVIKVTDANGGTSQITLTDYATLGITPPSITVTAGAGQTMQFSGFGGSGGYSYALVSGPGQVSPAGLYTAVNTSGTATVRVTDSIGGTATAAVRSLRIRVNGPVLAAVTDGTSWYLGGSFSAVNPYSAPGLAIVDASTGNPVLGCDLGSGFLNGVVTAVAASPTAIYVGGVFSSYRGTLVSGLVKLDPQTCALDTTFSTGGGFAPNGVSALALSGSSLYVAGNFTTYRGTAAQGLIKLDATTGALDPAFSAASAFRAGGGNSSPSTLTIIGSSLYAGGVFETYRGAPALYLCKLDLATGALDTTFQQGVKLNGQVNVLASSATALYAAGSFTQDGAQPVMLAKLDPATAAPDPTFAANAGSYPNVDAIAVSGTSVYVGLQFPSGSMPLLAKLDASSGVADAIFTQPGSLDYGVTSLLASGTSVYAGGYFSHYLGRSAFNLLKVDATTGVLDTTFTQPTGANGVVTSLAASGTTIYAAGELSTYRGQPANGITKIMLANDAIDPVFAQSTGVAGSAASVNALALAGASLYVAGSFSYFDGQTPGNLVKVDPNSGAPDAAFTAGTQISGISSVVSSGGALYVSTYATNCQATTLGCIAKLDPATGAADPTFAPAATTNGQVDALFASGGSLYAGGVFQTDNGLPAQNLAKVNPTTAALDQTFTGATGLVVSPCCALEAVDALALSGSSLYVGGDFTSYRGTAVSNLMKIDAASGALDTTFTQTSGAFVWVSTLAVANGSLYLGGQIASYRGTSLQNLAKVDLTSGALDLTFTQPLGACHGTVGCGGNVNSLTPVGTKLYVGGDVTSYRGVPAYFFFPVDPTSGALLDP